MSCDISVIIPSRNERYLQETVADLLGNASEEIEVIAVMDGESTWPAPEKHSTVKVIRHDSPAGMRQSINEAAKIAQGQWLLKADAHCLFSLGYDVELKRHCEKNWIAVPRRYALDVKAWKVSPEQTATDAHFLRWPFFYDPPALHGAKWPERTSERQDYKIDDEMSSQGSCWFMNREHFFDRIGLMDHDSYGSFSSEFQELGFKTWLGGGRVIVNKHCYYAHWHKPRDYGRGYHLSRREQDKGERFTFDYWWHNRWQERKHDLAWLIDRFWPVPGWPVDWRMHG